ncbi:MAG: hypothetical protein L3J84_02670 [Gammaproteobacteria bacterium]|nr:hypothetical protein [Gammaproteobacteria bacterium]
MVTEKLTREAVIEHVILTFIDNIGYLSESEKLSVNENTDIIKDFKMNTDDATLMIMDLKKHFSVNPSHEEWLQLSSIGETADLIIKHMRKKP